VDEDEDEDKDEDDGKEPQTIGEGEMVNISTDHVDSTVDDQPILLPEQGQVMREHTSRPQPPASAPRPKPWTLAHNHELPRLIPSVGESIWGLSR